VADAIPRPDGLPRDAATWEQTPLVVRQLVVQQEERIRTLEARMAELEARLQQRSRNADRPPSSDPPSEKPPARSGAQGRPGAKPGPPGHRQALLEPTQVIEVKPEACPGGQREFPEATPYYTHPVIELPESQMRVTPFVLHEARCPQCGRVTNAQGPPAAAAGHGPRLTALLGELSGSQRDSGSTVQECCQSVWGGPISRGAIQRAVDRVSAAITPPYEAMAKQARRAPVNDHAEPAWSQHGVLAWLWVMVTTTVACFQVQASRSKAAFEDLVERWAGSLVSAGDGVYWQWVHTRQACLAPLLRRARGLAERKDPEVAGFGHRVVTEWQRLVHWAQAPPTAGDGPTWEARMVPLLNRHQGRQDEAGKCARTLQREMASLGTCVVETGVEPTNNRAERALRCAVLWRKLMQGTYNEKGDRWVERMLSRRETCRLRGKPTFPVLVDAVTSYFNGQHPDVSWI
jgi:transposase